MQLHGRLKTVSGTILGLLFFFGLTCQSLSANELVSPRVDAIVDKNNEHAFATIAQAIEQAHNNLLL